MPVGRYTALYTIIVLGGCGPMPKNYMNGTVQDEALDNYAGASITPWDIDEPCGSPETPCDASATIEMGNGSLANGCHDGGLKFRLHEPRGPGGIRVLRAGRFLIGGTGTFAIATFRTDQGHLTASEGQVLVESVTADASGLQHISGKFWLTFGKDRVAGVFDAPDCAISH